MSRALTRENLAAGGLDSTAAPIRMAHFGLGAFHRAHQAWYTHRAHDRDHWGIAAFTGRSDEAARILAAQDGLYTLVQRGPTGDETQVVTSIVRAIPGSDLPSLLAIFSSPELAVVTITVTERGYRLKWDGTLDAGDTALTADLSGIAAAEPGTYAPVTVIGRLLAGLDARRRARLPGLAVVPCDNVPDNGRFLATGLHEAASLVSPELRDWIAAEVSVVSTSVDRITPRITRADIDAVNRESAWADAAPVITEPFTDWVLSGEFPAGHPAWEDSGARFVDDIEPWERRKLWMLNGAHTLLANAGLAMAHETVASAIGDPRLAEAVEGFWSEAAAHLPDEVDAGDYAASLRTRFANPRIEHRLAQIAEDNLAKLKLRIVPVAIAERAAGRSANACAFAIASWIVTSDAEPGSSLRGLSTVLSEDPQFVELVRERVNGLRSLPSSRDTGKRLPLAP